MRYSKYGAKKCVNADGQKFDSQAEMRRWEELRLLEMAGQIRGLERQKRWPLYAWSLTAFDEDGSQLGGVGYYQADFDYDEPHIVHNLLGGGASVDTYWEHVTEDSKGVRTAVYKIKARIFSVNYGRSIRET